MRFAALAVVAVAVVTLVTGVRGQDQAWIQEVCDRVRIIDTALVKHIENLATSNPDDFLNDMREYVQAIKNFQTCIKEDINLVADLAQDILDEEGPKFYYIYDPEYIQNLTNWGESEMDECNQLQKQAVEAWVDIDKALSVNKPNDKGGPDNMHAQTNANNNPEKEATEEEWKEHKFLDRDANLYDST